MFKDLASEIKIVEVGPRDGLQNEKTVLSTEDKFNYIRLLSQTGLKTIEATSFVRPSAIPQMGDSTELFNLVNKELSDSGISYPCLVPNLIGYNKAKDCGVKEIALFSATSDLFTQKNINCTVDESFDRMREVASMAKADGIKIRGYVSTAFGCPYKGEMTSAQLAGVIEKFLDLGVYEISIGDTIGVATPKQVSDYLSDISSIVSKDMLAMHFHDTRGMAIANSLVSLEKGITTFDASSGGLGGCPYAKGATGNVATEDLYYLFESLGVSTGVDLAKLAEASKFILEKVSKESPSKFYKTLKK